MASAVFIEEALVGASIDDGKSKENFLTHSFFDRYQKDKFYRGETNE